MKSRTKRRIISAPLISLFVVIVYKVLTSEELTNDKLRIVQNRQRQHRYVCPDVRQPEQFPDRDTWQGVGVWSKDDRIPQDRVYVFSAYIDISSKRISSHQVDVVRIVAIIKSKIERPFCQLWFNNDRELLIVPASVQTIPEHHGKPYKPSYFVCDLPSWGRPSAVSVVPNRCDQPQNVLLVQQEPAVKGKYKYTVCVKPVYRHYNDVYKLVEMIEVNRLFGAEFFVFYNYSIRSEANDVLRHYQSESLLEMVQWQLPVNGDNFTSDIWSFGQLAAQNDCMFRYRSSQYIVFIDLDEVIVPRRHETWDQMLSAFELGDAFIILCAIFRTEWPDYDKSFDNKTLAQQYRLMTLLKTDREPTILPRYVRSKLIVRPGNITLVGIHNVWSYRPGYHEVVVDPSVGLLHHYRSWGRPNDTDRLSDPYLHKLAKNITDALSHRWQKISLQGTKYPCCIHKASLILLTLLTLIIIALIIIKVNNKGLASRFWSWY